MTILGIDQITYGAPDLAACRRFFCDWGLRLVERARRRLVFESLNGCRVSVCDPAKSSCRPPFEDGPTLREVVWGVEERGRPRALRRQLAGAPGFVDDGARRIGCTDPNGMAVRFQVSGSAPSRCRAPSYNTWDRSAASTSAARSTSAPSRSRSATWCSSSPTWRRPRAFYA